MACPQNSNNGQQQLDNPSYETAPGADWVGGIGGNDGSLSQPQTGDICNSINEEEEVYAEAPDILRGETVVPATLVSRSHLTKKKSSITVLVGECGTVVGVWISDNDENASDNDKPTTNVCEQCVLSGGCSLVFGYDSRATGQLFLPEEDCAVIHQESAVVLKLVGTGTDVIVSTCGSSFSAMITILEGKCSLSRYVAPLSDTPCQGGTPRFHVAFETTFGAEYYVVVRGFKSDGGRSRPCGERQL